MTLRALYDLPAPAKLNLFLHVTGRRADGYHLLQSAFVPIDWCDALHLERRDDGTLRREDLGPALPADDLCLGAARALQRASGTSLGAVIRIDKRVPWGAGLGGGSSDAATVLLGLNRLWGLDWTRTRLAALALTLGADVPFFIHGRPAWVEGIGEHITPIPLPARTYAVLKPAAALPTAQIFRAPDLVRDTEPAILRGFPERHRQGSGAIDAAAAEKAEADIVSHPPLMRRVDVSDIVSGFGRNDLQAVAERLEPEVKWALELLRSRFGNSRMTGSGSAVFARVGEDAVPSAAMPADLPPGWVGRICRSLEVHPLWEWASD
jgi:4-diphosphocytidyl-2-C-methyl-D-erythritol kinase